MLLSGRPAGQRAVVAIDGRSSSGKTTLAHRMAGVKPRAAVVHTDDVAWWHSRFDWAQLLLDGIIEPFQAGQQVVFRPPAWKERGREGAINVDPESSVLIVEGVGCSRPEVARWWEASVWVQSGRERPRQAQRRPDRIRRDDLRRCGGLDERGVALSAADRPWERAAKIVAGTPEVRYDEVAEVLVASPFPQGE